MVHECITLYIYIYIKRYFFYFTDKDVRLSSSDLPNEGFVEITINNTRNKLCDESLDDKGKELVCRHLGYKGETQKVSSVLVDQSNARVLPGKISCSDEKTALSQCCITYATKYGICLSNSYVSCKFIRYIFIK